MTDPTRGSAEMGTESPPEASPAIPPKPTRGQQLLERMLKLVDRLQGAAANQEKALAGIRGPRVIPLSVDTVARTRSEPGASKAFFLAAEQIVGDLERVAGDLEAAPKELAETLF